MDRNIEYVIELWKEMSRIMTQIENRSSGIMNAMAVIGVGISIFSIAYEADAKQNLQIMEMIYYIAPIIVMLFLLTLGFDNRDAAILKGYLAGIEDLINCSLGKCIYQFNSLYPCLYSPKFFMTNNYLSVVYGSVVFFLSIVCFREIFLLNKLPIIIELLYFLIYLLNLLVTMKDLLTNPRIRKTARVYFHKSFNAYQINDIGYNLKDILNFEIDVDAMIREFDKNINNE